MPAQPAGPPRRTVATLGLGALAAMAATASRPARAGMPLAATLLVPGPEDGPIAVWSRRLAESLARTGQGGAAAIRVDPEILGGPDGVTAANRFATTAAPDGRTLLVLAGAAATARMVGDPRARFDPSGWLPLGAATIPVVLAVRADWTMPVGIGAGGGGRQPPLRIAIGAPDSARTAALLTLDLLGIPATPVPGLEAAQAEAALEAGAVEVALLAGAELPARLAALRARPWLGLHDPHHLAAGGDGLPTDLPSAIDLLRRYAPPGPLLGALRVMMATLCLPATLVLPALTGADLVAFWRAATERWITEEARGTRSGIRLLTGPEAAPLLGALAAPPPDAVSAYRDWLRRRLGWKPD